MVEMVGYGAAVCTTAAFAPQLVKAWRTRSTRDISLTMFLAGDWNYTVANLRRHETGYSADSPTELHCCLPEAFCYLNSNTNSGADPPNWDVDS